MLGIYKGVTYDVSEDNERVYAKAITRNKDGFFIHSSYTKNQVEEDETMEAVKNFLIREII